MYEPRMHGSTARLNAASTEEDISAFLLELTVQVDSRNDETEGGRNEPNAARDTEALLGSKGKGGCCCCTGSEDSAEPGQSKCKRCCKKILSIMYLVFKFFVQFIIITILVSISPIVIVGTILICSLYLAIANNIYFFTCCPRNENDAEKCYAGCDCYDGLKAFLKKYTSFCDDDGFCGDVIAGFVWFFVCIFTIAFTVAAFFAAIFIFLLLLFAVCLTELCCEN